jgi:hypothetical protein
MIQEVIKFTLATLFVSVVVLVLRWADKYENILPVCTKYADENYFWICSRNNRVATCEKTVAYQIKDACAYYNSKIICGSFGVEREQGTHCESWKPWFNRKALKGVGNE